MLTIIDAHSHLWLKQDTWVDGKRILSLKNGRSIFMDEEVQMVPPFMVDGVNSAEVFLSNMNYAQVGAAVVVQELIDGDQNEYLTTVQRQYPNRFFCMGMAWNLEEVKAVHASGLKGIAFPGHRMRESLLGLIPIFKYMEEKGMVLSMCLGEEAKQIDEMKEVIQECPRLKVAIGHFGMVTTNAFESQVKLAREGANVMVESGGITWLFNSEFYPYPSAVRSIRQAADWVGMDRLMWGSDYPRTITAITYKMSYDFITKSKELTEKEKQMFLGENAKAFYGFKNLPELPYIKNMSE
ncbi:MAG: amidohydrolase [Bacteroidaceae bacterium]|nr:amidohydrolase [Bacteroidaceae bacterium]